MKKNYINMWENMYSDKIKHYNSLLNEVENRIKTTNNMLQFYKNRFANENSENEIIKNKKQEAGFYVKLYKTIQYVSLGLCFPLLAIGVLYSSIPSFLSFVIFSVSFAICYDKNKEYKTILQKFDRAYESIKELEQKQEEIINKHTSYINILTHKKEIIKNKIVELENAQRIMQSFNLNFKPEKHENSASEMLK